MKFIFTFAIIYLYTNGVSARVGCPKNYKPVLCGKMQEEYSNMCIAEQTGGFSKNDCVSKDQNGDPFYEYDPVICGPNSEFFDNIYLARQGGHDDAACTYVNDIMCPAIYDPVLCGPLKEFFSSTCEAEKFGYNKDKCKPEEETPDDDTFCAYVYDPVVCGPNNDFFSNMCEAEKGGYHQSECTREEHNDGDEDTFCPYIHDPMICRTGADQQEVFPNMCSALKHGGVSNENDCTCYEYEEIIHHMASFFGEENCKFSTPRVSNNADAEVWYDCYVYDGKALRGEVTAAHLTARGLMHENPVPQSLNVDRVSSSSQYFYDNNCGDFELTAKLLKF